MSDTWNEIQSLKTKQSSLREKLLKRKKEREGLVADITGTSGSVTNSSAEPNLTATKPVSRGASPVPSNTAPPSVKSSNQTVSLGPEFEKKLLSCLVELGLNLPIDVNALINSVSKLIDSDVPMAHVEGLLEKFAAQTFIVIEKKDGESSTNKSNIQVISVDHAKLEAMMGDGVAQDRKRTREKESATDEPPAKISSKQQNTTNEDNLIESLLSMQSAKEKENKKLNEEILELLTKPTAKEQSLVEKFKSQGGAQVKEFCPFGTKEECKKLNDSNEDCKKLHFRKIIHKHTDESLGDCSFLNTCFHMDTCKYVHYEIDLSYQKKKPDIGAVATATAMAGSGEKVTLIPPQWICCDVRQLDMSVLGKFSVIMADPPWDIHMELPYGTMSDDEMRGLNIPTIQDEGYLFLWVTGRAMELGRECLKLWGYERCDELIWVKTNQLQRIIRTGRTGHWINHGKEHCLIGVKGTPKNMNRGLDCDVLVAEVRATSHKPDEIYGMIERLSPGTRKLELFGRPHNVQPNWITLGNQVDGVRLLEPDVVRRFKKCYPDGNCLKPNK